MLNIKQIKYHTDMVQISKTNILDLTNIISFSDFTGYNEGVTTFYYIN